MKIKDFFRQIKILPDNFNRFFLYLKNEYLREADIYVVSFPKAGRTWLRVLLGKYFCQKYGVSDNLMLEIYQLTKKAGLPTMLFTHDKSSLMEAIPYSHLSFNRKKYQGKKVVFLVRDIRDVLVSNYFQATQRNKIYQGTISQFIRDEKWGAKKVIAFYNLWHRNKNIPLDFLVVRYEDIHQDPFSQLKKILTFCGIRGIDKGIIKKSVLFASFDKMRKKEKEGSFNESILKPGKANSEESFKTRKGKVGGYKDYLSDSDIVYIQKKIKEEAIDDCNWYFGY